MWQKIKNFLLHNRTTKQTVVKNAFWLAVGNIGSKILRAVLIIYAARILGTAGYGIFSYALSLAAFFTIFSDIGLSPLLTREAVKKPDRIATYISTTFFLKLIVLAITIVITIVFAPIVTKIPEARTLIPIVTFLLIFDTLRGFGFAITRAQNKMQTEALYTILTDVFITGLSLVVLFINPTSKALAISYTAGSGLGMLALFIALRGQIKNMLSHFDRTLLRPIFAAAWPFAIMGLLGGFMINIDTIIIGWFRTANELGLYGAAQRPIQLLYLLPGLLSISLFPILSGLIHRKDETKIRRILELSVTASLGLALPLAAGGIILGAPIVRFLFGGAYMGATLTFQLLLITLIPIFPGTIITNTVFAYDEQKIFVVSTSVGSVANVIFDLLFIPKFGIAGSAIATIISQILAIGIIRIKMQHINSFRTIVYLPKIIIASTIMSAVAYFGNQYGIPILANVLVSGIVYGGILYLLKEKLIDELKPSSLLG